MTTMRASIRDRLHPFLRSRLAELEEGPHVFDPAHWEPGFHSEVDALNQFLWTRGVDASEVDLADLLLYNQNFDVGPVDRCANCRALTRGVTTVGGHD